MKNYILLLFALGFGQYSIAQKNVSTQATQKDGKLHIKTIIKENGKTKVSEKTIDLDDKNKDNVDDLINITIDSLDGENGDFDMKITNGGKGKKDVKVYKYKQKHSFGDSLGNNPRVEIFDGDDHHFKFDMGDLGDALEKSGMQIEKMLDDAHIGENIERGMKHMKNFRFEDMEVFGANPNMSKTIKNLKARPNKPSDGTLNIEFEALENTDVKINLTDVNGKVIGSKTVAKFSGNFLGQLDLKTKDFKGTAFLTVVQGADGATKRVVIE